MANAKKSAEPFEAQPGKWIRPFKPSSSKPPSGHGSLVIVVAIIIMVGLVLVTGLFLYVHSRISAIIIPPSNVLSGPIYGSLSLGAHGILTYNYSNDLVGYAKVHYSESNASYSQLSLVIYPSNPSETVYLVNLEGYCVQCFIGSSLFTDLNSSMNKYGLMLNKSSLKYIDINQLSLLPQHVTVIIPSGLIPNILLPNATYTERCTNYANISILTLLSRGDTIIYVGRNFTRSVSCSGQIAQNTNNEISTLTSLSNYTTNSSNVSYLNSTLFFSNATFNLKSGRSFGPITSAQILNGTLVVLPNYPSVGWGDNSSKLASDLAAVMSSRFWLPPLAYGSEILPNSNSNYTTIFTLNSTIKYSTSVSTFVNGTHALLQLYLFNGNRFQVFGIPFRYTFRQNGIISMPSVVGISQPAQISVQVLNATRNKTVITFVPILNQNLTAADNNPIHIGLTGATTLFTFSSFYLPTGYYIAELMDQQGSTYSSALFHVENSTINATKLDFENATFLFSVLSNGQSLNGVGYQISINNAYNSSGVINGGVLRYTLPQGASLSYGNGTFMVGIMGSSYPIPYQYTSPNTFNIPPLYIAFAIAAIAIIILNRVLVPSNVDDYYIDVPDIKPAKLEYAKESTDSILSVFDKINLFYRWVYMPLTAEEIKSGISTNIKYGSTRMTITLRNTYAILNTLVKNGDVQMADDYYAPTKWLRASGYTMAYLVIYRKLKDYCISNAMFMTEMGTSSKADVIVTNKGAQNYIKIYSADMKIKDIDISQKIRTFIVFLEEEDRLSFMDRLYKSYNNNAEILKMAINYGNVKLIDSNNLDELRL